MSRVTYQSPRNTVFYFMERGGLYTLDDVAHGLHMGHESAERALDANVRLGRLVKDGEFYTVAETYRIRWTLPTWDILAERLLQKLPDGPRKVRCQAIYDDGIQN